MTRAASCGAKTLHGRMEGARGHETHQRDTAGREPACDVRGEGVVLFMHRVELGLNIASGVADSPGVFRKFALDDDEGVGGGGEGAAEEVRGDDAIVAAHIVALRDRGRQRRPRRRTSWRTLARARGRSSSAFKAVNTWPGC